MTRAVGGTEGGHNLCCLGGWCWASSAGRPQVLGTREGSLHPGLWASVPTLPLASVPRNLCLVGTLSWSVGGAEALGLPERAPWDTSPELPAEAHFPLTQTAASPCRFRGFILLLTFFIYTCYHMSRKPISVVKVRLAWR